MKNYFGVQTAIRYIANGEKVKMVSTDFKSHFFYLGKNKSDGRSIIHEVKKNGGSNIILHVSYDDMKEKFKNNEFYIYEEKETV